MIYYVLAVFIFMSLLGVGIFIVEARNAPIMDEKEPFLHDDYDPKKDESVKMKIKPTEISCSGGEKTIEVEIVKE